VAAGRDLYRRLRQHYTEEAAVCPHVHHALAIREQRADQHRRAGIGRRRRAHRRETMAPMVRQIGVAIPHHDSYQHDDGQGGRHEERAAQQQHHVSSIARLMDSR